MRRLRIHPLLALLCAVSLFAAQLAADAHFIWHLGVETRAASLHKDSQDVGAPALDGVCKTCIAFAAMSSAPPARTPLPDAPRLPSSRPLFVPAVFVPAPAAPPYASRAPPAVL